MLSHTRRPLPYNASFGFTLIELLVSIAIIAVLAIAFLLTVQTQLGKARDAERKDDLQKIKVAFENYYNNNDCYPPEGTLTACDSADFTPYLNAIPCDPLTKQPYEYMPLNGDACSGYRILVSLEYPKDPGIWDVGCSQSLGCGTTGVFPTYNYGVAEGTQVPEDGFVADEDAGGAGEPRYFCAKSTENCSACSGTCPGANVSWGDYQTLSACQNNCPPPSQE